MFSPSTSMLLLLLFTVVRGIQFSFIPSPNITLQQSAEYQCAVTGVGSDSDTVSIQWNVNGTSSASSTWQSFITNAGITVIGDGIRNRSLIIPGEPAALNKTAVKCIASGIIEIDGVTKNYHNTSSEILYIQGPPSPVGSLQGVLISLFRVYINWSVPYTIMGVDITGYNMNITRDNAILNQSFVTNTGYYYNVSQFGVYDISVAAVIGNDLEGKINTVMVVVPEVMIHSFSIDLLYKNGNWIAQCIIMGPQFSNPHPTLLILTTTRSQSPGIVYKTKVIAISDSVIMSEIVLDSVEIRQRMNATITLEYSTGIKINSDQIERSTFGVQIFSIISSSNGLCCQCRFITDGNYVKGCFVQYKCEQALFNGRFNITVSEQQQCVEDIYTSVYNITVYDIESDGTVRMDQPVFEINNVSVTGTTYTYPQTSTTTTTDLNDSNTTRSSTNNSTLIERVLYVIGSLTVLVLVLVMVIVVLLIVLKCQSNSNDKNFSNGDGKKVHTVIIRTVAFDGPGPRSLVDEFSGEEPKEPLKLLQRHVLLNDKNSSTTTLDPAGLQKFGSNNIRKRSKVFKSQRKVDTAELSYSFIKDNVALAIPHRWEEFGKHLAVKPDKLHEIRENNPHNNTNAFCDVISVWHESTIRPFTWGTLDMVLTVMRETELLMSIKRESN